jgi:acyl carrier protein
MRRSPANPSDPDLDRATLEQELIELISWQLLDVPQGLEASSNLPAAGLDSMAIMQLLILIEDRYGLWLPETDLVKENFADVRALAALLAKRLNGSRAGNRGNGR